MSDVGDGACCWRFDEFGSKTEEFLVCVFFDIADDLCVSVSWVCVCCVFEAALDSDDAYGFEFVCVGDDVADMGVVNAEDCWEVERCSRHDGFVFCAERDVFDDIFDFVVV